MKIGGFDLDRDVLIIAEIGLNHEGSFALAEELIGLAALSGAGAVKFQTIVPERLVSKENPGFRDLLKKYSFSYDQFASLAATAKREGVMFLSTPFDIESARFLEPHVPAFKIASGDNNFFALIDAVARMGKPILLSTGFVGLAEIRSVKTFIESVWSDAGRAGELVLMHCVSAYPTEATDAHLGFLTQLRELGATVGYSDHTLGIDAAVVAVAMGARVIEKHFTKSKTLSDFQDHKLSADPDDMARMVEKIRQTLEYIGEGEKRLLEVEEANFVGGRRSIVAGRDLAAGATLSMDDLDWLRPATGIAPGWEGEIVGRRLRKGIAMGERILIDDLE